MEKESPTVQLSTTIKFQIPILTLVCSIREQNFDLYKAALVELMPCFFSLDHPNYARWLPVHKIHPLEKFREGNFT